MLDKLSKKLWTSLLWTGLIFILLSIHTGTMESVPMLGFRHWDKLVHLFIFAMLVWLWASFFHGKGKLGPSGLWIITILGILYGAGMEFYQEYFTTREFEVMDIVSDGIGAVLGAVYFWQKNKPLWK